MLPINTDTITPYMVIKYCLLLETFDKNNLKTYILGYVKIFFLFAFWIWLPRFSRIIAQKSWCKTNFHSVRTHLGIYYELLPESGNGEELNQVLCASSERPCKHHIRLVVSHHRDCWCRQCNNLLLPSLSERWNNFNNRIIITIFNDLLAMLMFNDKQVFSEL